MATEEYQKAIASETATKCLEKVQQNATSTSAEASENKCKNKARRAVFCVLREFLIACPAAQQVASDECDKVREMAKNGDPKMMARGPRDIAENEEE